MGLHGRALVDPRVGTLHIGSAVLTFGLLM